MIYNWIWDIIAIDGKIAASIRERRSLLLSPLIVFTAAQIHGLTMFYFRIPSGEATVNIAEAGFYVVFSYMAVIASQLGMALLLWGIGKVMGGAASRFVDVFIAVGYAFLPYGILLAANTYRNVLQLQGENLIIPVLIMTAAVAYLVFLLTKALHLLSGFPMKRAMSCVLAVFIFVLSFIYLVGY